MLETNIPLPRARAKYPFDEMVVGQCLTLPVSEYRRMNGAASIYKRKTPAWAYAIRKQGEIARLWRVA